MSNKLWLHWEHSMPIKNGSSKRNSKSQSRKSASSLHPIVLEGLLTRYSSEDHWPSGIGRPATAYTRIILSNLEPTQYFGKRIFPKGQLLGASIYCDFLNKSVQMTLYP